MNDKLILHRTKPNGDELADWEFKYIAYRKLFTRSVPFAMNRCISAWLISLNHAGIFVLKRWYYGTGTPERWSRIHATGFMLPDGTEVILPKGKK